MSNEKTTSESGPTGAMNEQPDTSTSTDKSMFPKATVETLWNVIEMLRPGLTCDRRRGVDDKDCPAFGDGDRKYWCATCRARAMLKHSHEHTEHMELLRPSTMDPADPKLTHRERLLCAIQRYADAWKQGEGAAINESKSPLYQALDAFEFDIQDQLMSGPPPCADGKLPAAEEKNASKQQPDLAGVLKWLDEREAFRLASLRKGSDPTVLGYPGWAAKLLRTRPAQDQITLDGAVVVKTSDGEPPSMTNVLKWLDDLELHRVNALKKGFDHSIVGYPGWTAKMLRSVQSRGQIDLTTGKSEEQPTREQSPGLKEVLNWLETEEADFQVANEHTIGIPPMSRYGRGAKLLRFFHSEWAAAKSVQEKLEDEVLRLQVLLGRMPSIYTTVEIACQAKLARSTTKIDAPLESITTEWQKSEVGQLWCVGLRDEPGFSVVGSKYIYVGGEYGKTWRFPKKDRP
jgi:hypothetical protein